MEEIKRRLEVIQVFDHKKCTTPYSETTIETMCLQLRKILELIALSSLVANKKEFSKFNQEFHRMWNAKLILRDIERINPDFYPIPLVEKESTEPGISVDITRLKEGFLTRKEFPKVYEKCGSLMHASNPFSSGADYSYYSKNIPIWVNKIIKLLNSHYIRLIHSKNTYIVHMKSQNDGRVYAYTTVPNQ